MKFHTKVYYEFFDYPTDPSYPVPCEICGRRANDIHHIDARGMGGDPNAEKDVIENLMGLCRDHHNLYGDKKQFIEYLKGIHLSFMGTANDWNT